MMFALEKSGTTPRNLMSLDVEDMEEDGRELGVIEYISAFQSISCDGVFSDETIANYGINDVDWRSFPESMPDLSDTGRGYQEYSIACNPTLLLLHIDQGTETGGLFVPFASPRVNCRAVKCSHIEKITDVIIKAKQPLVTTMEDYSVFPYQVSIGTNETPGLSYSSVLNRDPGSNKIDGKVATIFDLSTVWTAHRMVKFGMALYPMASSVYCSSVWNHSHTLLFCDHPPAVG